MRLAQGWVASNPDIKMIQKTVSVCGPFLNIVPTKEAPCSGGRRCQVMVLCEDLGEARQIKRHEAYSSNVHVEHLP